MIWKAVIILVVAAYAHGGRIATSEQKMIKRIIEQGDKTEHGGKYPSAYPSYEFSYKVEDPHTKDIKGQEETRDGDKVNGKYWLVEPYGGKRIVEYQADKHDGFSANVKYSSPQLHVYHNTRHNQHESSEEKKESNKDTEEQTKSEEPNEDAADEEPSKIDEPLVVEEHHEIIHKPHYHEERQHSMHRPSHIPDVRLHKPYQRHYKWNDDRQQTYRNRRDKTSRRHATEMREKYQ